MIFYIMFLNADVYMGNLLIKKTYYYGCVSNTKLNSGVLKFVQLAEFYNKKIVLRKVCLFRHIKIHLNLKV